MRGEPVKQAWEAIKTIDHSDRDSLKKRIILRGRSHLTYILNNVPKFMGLKKRHRLLNLLQKISTIRDFEEFLKDLPITEKHEIIENPDSLTSREIEKIPTFKTHSSGTTGQSIYFPKDMIDWAQSHANMFYILSLYNINPFAPYVYYWAGSWDFKTRVEYLKKDIVLNRLRLTSYDTSEKHLIKQFNLMRKFKPHYILGIPSGIATFASYVHNESLELPKELQRVFTTGEMLYSYQRDLIKRALKVPVTDIYGTAEVGIIAFECQHGHLHVLVDTNFLEVLEDGTILLTNLFQKAFAIVRYKIGDISKSGLMWDTDCFLSYPIIKGIEGRVSDKIVLPNGKTLPRMAPTYIFDKIAHTRSIIKFRYELNKEELILKVVVNQRFNEEIKEFITSESERIFGIKPQIRIVKQISPLRGGKERYFVYAEEL